MIAPINSFGVQMVSPSESHAMRIFRSASAMCVCLRGVVCVVSSCVGMIGEPKYRYGVGAPNHPVRCPVGNSNPFSTDGFRSKNKSRRNRGFKSFIRRMLTVTEDEEEQQQQQ